MNVVIPREDGSAKVCRLVMWNLLITTVLFCKGDDHSHESKKHKSRDLLKKVDVYKTCFDFLSLLCPILQFSAVSVKGS